MVPARPLRLPDVPQAASRLPADGRPEARLRLQATKQGARREEAGVATSSATVAGGVTARLQVTPVAIMALDVEIRPGPGRQGSAVLETTRRPLVGRELERLTSPTMMVGPTAVVARLLAAVTPILREVAGVLGLGGPFRGTTTVLGSWRPSFTPLLRRRLPVLQVLLRHPSRSLRLKLT